MPSVCGYNSPAKPSRLYMVYLHISKTPSLASGRPVRVVRKSIVVFFSQKLHNSVPCLNNDSNIGSASEQCLTARSLETRTRRPDATARRHAAEETKRSTQEDICRRKEQATRGWELSALQ